MPDRKEINLKRISLGRFSYSDRDVYRNKISAEGKYSFKLDYKHSSLFIICDRDIGSELEGYVRDFYKDIEEVIDLQPDFEKSLVPLKSRLDDPLIIRDMYNAGEVFRVGPMASVAGALCDYLAINIAGKCSFLMIENGGDVYIKSSSPLEVGIFTKNSYFKDRLTLLIEPGLTPCGICSSSGSFGHSLSLGKSDLVTVLSGSTTAADAAATAIANTINNEDDIYTAIERFRAYDDIKGLIIIKNRRIGLWGQLQLAPIQK